MGDVKSAYTYLLTFTHLQHFDCDICACDRLTSSSHFSVIFSMWSLLFCLCLSGRAFIILLAPPLNYEGITNLHYHFPCPGTTQFTYTLTLVAWQNL